MNLKFNAEIINPHILLTKAGYHVHKNGSYALRLGGSEFPRFHVYPQKTGEIIKLSLHLDQSKTIYYNQKAHRGESNSMVVLEESARLKRWIEYFEQSHGTSK